VRVRVIGGMVCGMQFYCQLGVECVVSCWREEEYICFGGCDPDTGETTCIRWPVEWCGDECDPEDNPPDDNDGEDNND
jgi:hypothetical protein